MLSAILLVDILLVELFFGTTRWKLCYVLKFLRCRTEDVQIKCDLLVALESLDPAEFILKLLALYVYH